MLLSNGDSWDCTLTDGMEIRGTAHSQMEAITIRVSHNGNELMNSYICMVEALHI